MIISMGVDIVEIEEIKSSILKSKRFVERVFTSMEIAYCESKIDRYPHYAARFVAKEAVMKSLGTGWDKGVQWKQIEVVRGTDTHRVTTEEGKKELEIKNQTSMGSGKPYIRLSGEAQVIAADMGVKNILVSLSHSKKYAMAGVVFEG